MTTLYREILYVELSLYTLFLCYILHLTSPPSPYQLHPLLPCMAAASNFSIYIAMLCMLVYYVSVFQDICVGLNLPLLSPIVNVYCDGVYDMLHLGHMKAFENALRVSGGHRLHVGVSEGYMALNQDTVFTTPQHTLTTPQYTHCISTH